MAKKKSGGSNIGLILTLIFFVLATFISGALAYFGYEEVADARAKAEQAKKAQTNAENEYRNERIRKVMLRIAMAVEDPEDRKLLVQELEPLRLPITEEFERMKRGLDGKVPMIPDPQDPEKKPKSAFYWPILSMKTADVQKTTTDDTGAIKEGADLGPATGPRYTMPAIMAYLTAESTAAEAKQRDAENRMATAEKKAADAAKGSGAIDTTFKDAVAKNTKDKTDDMAARDAAFKKFLEKHALDAENFRKQLASKGLEIKEKEAELALRDDKIKALTLLKEKLESQNTNKQTGAVAVDSLNTEEKKGEIIRKDGNGFVTINIGSSKKLRPQVTFLVVSADVSWLALQDKEKALDRASSRIDRQPYEDNPYVKAGIEVVEVLGPESARAKIIFENEPIRNPVQVRDQIFNLAWQPAEEIRIAFAGIIDLDGDGLDNNEEFLRLLERQGVVIDEYLKLKPLGFVKRDGRGMSLRTKYLVIAPNPKLDSTPLGKDTPQSLQIAETIKQMSDIRNRAREMGVQVIEAHKFLTLIGYKLPRNPLPPNYGSAAYLEGGASAPAPAPMSEPKKEGN